MFYQVKINSRRRRELFHLILGHVLRVFLNDLKNIPHKACPLRFCAKEKLAYKKNK